MKTWKQLFEEVPWYKKNTEDYNINDLLAFNGHSVSKTGAFEITKWENLINRIKHNINYDENKTYKILDIGCGAGAMLKYFEKNDIYGIEPSKKFLNIIKSAIPNGKYTEGDALSVNQFEDNYFDFIFCYSASQYFPDDEYLNKFTNLCYNKLKKGGIIFVGDILNLELKDTYINYRILKLGKEKYKKLYSDHNLNHHYVSRKNINNYFEKYNNILIEDADKRGDEDLSYRFDVYYQK